MQAYCFTWRQDTNNITSKKVIITNKVVREKSRCSNCMVNKSR